MPVGVCGLVRRPPHRREASLAFRDGAAGGMCQLPLNFEISLTNSLEFNLPMPLKPPGCGLCHPWHPPLSADFFLLSMPPLGSARLASAHASVQHNSVQHASVQHASVQHTPWFSTRLGSAHLGWRSARLGSATPRFRTPRFSLGSARLGSARLSSACLAQHASLHRRFQSLAVAETTTTTLCRAPNCNAQNLQI